MQRFSVSTNITFTTGPAALCIGNSGTSMHTMNKVLCSSDTSGHYHDDHRNNASHVITIKIITIYSNIIFIIITLCHRCFVCEINTPFLNAYHFENTVHNFSELDNNNFENIIVPYLFGRIIITSFDDPTAFRMNFGFRLAVI